MSQRLPERNVEGGGGARRDGIPRSEIVQRLQRESKNSALKAINGRGIVKLRLKKGGR